MSSKKNRFTRLLLGLLILVLPLQGLMASGMHMASAADSSSMMVQHGNHSMEDHRLSSAAPDCQQCEIQCAACAAALHDSSESPLSQLVAVQAQTTFSSVSDLFVTRLERPPRH